MKRRDLPDGTRFRWACEHGIAGSADFAGNHNDGQAECEVEPVDPTQVVAHAFALLIEHATGGPT